MRHSLRFLVWVPYSLIALALLDCQSIFAARSSDLRLSAYCTAGDVQHYLATPEGRRRTLAALRPLHPSHLFLEGRRGDEHVSRDLLRELRRLFATNNIECSGGIATVPGEKFGLRQTGGFVTGGGWINSPAGAFHPDLEQFGGVTGKATFGFVSKYQKGANVPTGNTEFQFKAGELHFKSTAYQWLVVSGARAQFKGSGTINGDGNYGFILTAIDGQLAGGGGFDRFRIKIWDATTGVIVYDNQAGSNDTAGLTQEGTLVQGGSIVIQKK